MSYSNADKTEKETVTGLVESVIFQSPETGYTVCEIEDENGLPQTLVGTMPYLSEGDTVTAAGRFINHPTYGRQFKVEMYEKTLPTGEDDIYRYLASGAIRGIGPKTAERIVEKFGDDSFDVIENHPDWLAEIPGISRRKALEISESFSDMSGARSVMMFCSEFFGSATSMKIYRKWGGGAVDRIRKNPFSLCESFSGIGFARADSIAESCGIAKDSTERICAGIIHILRLSAHTGGHTCLPRETVLSETSKLTETDIKFAENALQKLLSEKKIFEKKQDGVEMIFLARYRNAELFCAETLKKINSLCPTVSADDIDGFINKAQLQSGITYAALQREAIYAALRNGIMVLTGGPGTGKTTIIKALISILSDMGMKCALCAPTGRAAKRMSEATGHEAKTVHRLLEMERSDENDEPVFTRCEKNRLDENTVIVDETSMMDILLLEALLKAVKPGSRLIFIGDRDQLPSVGAGNVLADIIDSKVFETVCLTEIFRQAEESRIIVNAHLINEGKLPLLDNKSKDFFFLSREGDRETAMTVADLVKNRLPRAYGGEIADGIQVITPSRKGDAGTASLNALLQERLNPPTKGKKQKEAHGIMFREGDRVMQNKNDYAVEWEKDGSAGLGIFNGDIGTLSLLDPAGGTMELDFDGRIAEYEFSQFEELEHAYAITVHKSQGSEYPVVIIPLYGCAPMLLTRNLLYTAVTRAEKMVVLVGRRDILEKMVSNNRYTKRYSGLCSALCNDEQ